MVILTDGAQRPSPESLGLDVVRLEPQRLELRMIVRTESVILEDLVELLEVTTMERDDGFGF